MQPKLEWLRLRRRRSDRYVCKTGGIVLRVWKFRGEWWVNATLKPFDDPRNVDEVDSRLFGHCIGKQTLAKAKTVCAVMARRMLGEHVGLFLILSSAADRGGESET